MRRSFHLQLLLELFTATLASNRISPRPATSFQVPYLSMIWFNLITIVYWLLVCFRNLENVIYLCVPRICDLYG